MQPSTTPSPTPPIHPQKKTNVDLFKGDSGLVWLGLVFWVGAGWGAGSTAL